MLEAHGIYLTSDSSKRTMHGVGMSVGWSGYAGAAVLIETVGVEYLREPAFGPGQGSVVGSLAVAANRDSGHPVCRRCDQRE